jgi:hypothetical protein
MQKNQQWKDKVQELFQVCQDELKKTTKIGKKMLSASKTNTNLHDAYEEIGRLAVKALEKDELEWKNPRVSELLAVVQTCEVELKSIETDVNKIKFASGPVDVSAKNQDSETKESKESKEKVKDSEKKH